MDLITFLKDLITDIEDPDLGNRHKITLYVDATDETITITKIEVNDKVKTE